jgi:hypothetical protein
VPSLSPSSNLSQDPNGNPVLSLDPSINPWEFSSDDDDDDLINVDDDDNLMRLQNFDLNDIEGMSQYKLMRLQRVHRNNARLPSLGLLAPMTSATTLSSDRSNRKKRGKMML